MNGDVRENLMRIQPNRLCSLKVHPKAIYQLSKIKGELIMLIALSVAVVKKCKSLRGLKTHKRSCRVIIGLNEEIVSTNDTETDEIINDNLEGLTAENLP